MNKRRCIICKEWLFTTFFYEESEICNSCKHCNYEVDESETK